MNCRVDNTDINQGNADDICQTAGPKTANQRNTDKYHGTHNHTAMEGENLRQQRGQNRTACHVLQSSNNAHNDNQTNRSDCTAFSIIVELKEFRDSGNLHRTQLACCQKAHNNSTDRPRAVIPACCQTNTEGTLCYTNGRSSTYCQTGNIDSYQNCVQLTASQQKCCRTRISLVLNPQADAKKQRDVHYDNYQLNRHKNYTTFLPCYKSIILVL